MPGPASASGTTADGGVSSVAWHPSHTAKAQHALSLFANLRAHLRTAEPAAPSTPLPADPPPRATSATRRRQTSAPSKKTHAARTGGDGGHAAWTPTAAAAMSASTTPTARAGHRSGNHTPQRAAQHRTEEDLVAPPTYTEAELEAFSPAQLRRQLRVAGAVTQRLQLRARRLEAEAELWKRRCAEHETDTGQRAAASISFATEPAGHSSIVRSNSVERSRGEHSPRSDAAADAVSALQAADARTTQLQATVHRLDAHKEELTRRLYAAEKSIKTLTIELQAATARAATASAPAQTSPSTRASAATPASHAPPQERQPSARAGASSSSPTKTTSGSSAAADASGESIVLLRDTVRDLQHRLTQSEAQTKQAVQVQLDALLRYRESTPAAVALVNTEVQRLFHLMQQQLVTNAVQQQTERARMNELFYQLERGRSAH